MTIQSKLLESLHTFGDNVAIESAGKKTTYQELRNTADRITGELLGRGVGAEALIGIRLTRVEEIIAAMIGVMNARCVVVPIDASLPERLLGSMIDQLNLSYTITPEVYAEIASKGGRQEAVVYPEFQEADSIYLYFTSGSSGTPKGVLGVNGSLLHFLQWELEKFKPEVAFRFSQFVSPYFDAFLRDIFLPLLAGGTICIPPGGREFFEPATMIAWINENRIQLIHCVPSIFRLFNTDMLTSGHFKYLRFILMSGEKLIPAELVNWYSKFGSRIQLVNLYGSTEATMIQSCYLIQPEDAGKARISIGEPIADTEFIILNTGFKSCGPLVTGDLYVLSDFMTRGYINNPELTAERFLKIGAGGVERIAYKTGDKARVLTDGTLELMGRDDRQVKLRGIRIELDAIENVLVGSVLVKSAYVVKDQEMNHDESLIAFVVLNRGWEDYERWSADLEQHVRTQLPEYMVPSKFVALKEFPMLSNGKIDLKKLLLLPTEAGAADIVAPGDELESGILAIWKEILGNKPISVEESFHTAGGNSLSIMKLIGRIYKKYNVRITLSELFNNLTVKKQAAIIRKFSDDYLCPIPKTDKKTAYRVSAVQEMIYTGEAPGGTTHNNPIAWELPAEWDMAKTERVLRELIARHEALRTGFHLENGELRQTVYDAVEFEIEQVQIQAETLQEAIAGYIRPFDPAVAPLMRAGVVTFGGGKQALVIDLHRIICDEPSQAILFADLLNLYNGDEPVPATIQPKDHAEWEWALRSRGAYLAQREFWLKQFEEGIPPIDLPVIEQGSKANPGRGGSIYFELGKEDISWFIDHLQDNGLDTFSGLFCLYFIFLCQLTGQEDRVIGVPVSGRMEELGNTVGMFTKTLPIRYKLDAEMPFSEVLKEVGARLREARGKQLYDPSAIRTDTLFDYRDSKNDRYERFSHPKYPLSLYIADSGVSFECRMEYSAAYFTKTDAKMLADQFKELVGGLSQPGSTRVIDMIGLDQEIADPAEDDLSFNF